MNGAKVVAAFTRPSRERARRRRASLWTTEASSWAGFGSLGEATSTITTSDRIVLFPMGHRRSLPEDTHYQSEALLRIAQARGSLLSRWVIFRPRNRALDDLNGHNS
jgi:hypothetical protein